MSSDWRMDIRNDELPPPEWYEAECQKVEDVDTAFGARLRWVSWLPKLGTETAGWTSMSPSTQARAYQWAEKKLNGGPISPEEGWGPETVEGKGCRVKVEHYDSKGQLRAKVAETKPLGENTEEEAGFSDVSSR